MQGLLERRPLSICSVRPREEERGPATGCCRQPLCGRAVLATGRCHPRGSALCVPAAARTCPERSHSWSKSTYSSSLLYMPRPNLSGFPLASRRNFSLHRLSKSLDRWRLTWISGLEGRTLDFATQGFAGGCPWPGSPSGGLKHHFFFFYLFSPTSLPPASGMLIKHTSPTNERANSAQQNLLNVCFFSSLRRFCPRGHGACAPKSDAQNLNHGPPWGSHTVHLQPHD